MSHGKRLVEATLAGIGRLGLTRRRVRGRTLILAYHNVIPDGTTPNGDLPLHLSLSAFQEHMDAVQSLCEVVGLDQLSIRSPRGRPRVVITFDDAYRGAVRLALPELCRRGLPSTVFVAPAYVPNKTFWWDDLARATGGALTTQLRIQALEAWNGREVLVRRALPAADQAATGAPTDLRCATLDELLAAVGDGPVTLGSHTWSHPNLTCLEPHELAEELSRPFSWLTEHFPATAIPFVSYPYGLNSGAVRAAAAAAGYAGGLCVMGGWMKRDAHEPFSIPRKNIPAGLSAEGLALRLTGMIKE